MSHKWPQVTRGFDLGGEETIQFNQHHAELTQPILRGRIGLEGRRLQTALECENLGKGKGQIVPAPYARTAGPINEREDLSLRVG